MLNTTQNTRKLGGYQTVYGVPTRERTVIRSDVQCCPDEEDCLFLKSNGITTIIDMNGRIFEVIQRQIRKYGFIFQ